MSKKAIVYFHQGWTDIIVCLPLINYYKKFYEEIVVLIRSEAKDLVDFYVKNLQGVNILYLQTDNGRWYGKIISSNEVKNVTYFMNGQSGFIYVPDDYDMMCHAEHDMWRKDELKNFWSRFDKPYIRHFTEMFYIYYGIDFMERINSFSIERDYELEEKTYQSFIGEYGKDYILYHDDQENHLHGGLHVSTKIDFSTKLENVNYVNLNKKSSIFFDYLKVLINAKELHFVDSIWGAICYQLDSKYSLFKNKNVKIYCKRGHYGMFDTPKKLDNWELI